MCGLLGIASAHLHDPELSAFEKLLLVSQFRGVDATGIVALSRHWGGKGKAEVTPVYMKDNMSTSEFLLEYRGRLDKLYKDNRPSVLMGHCRWATVGDINKQNSHPFNNKWLIGMHNGTIQGEFSNSKKFATDSEALLFNIGEMGVVEALNEVSRKISTAYALTWYNKADQTLNFIRNSQRPLIIGRNNTANILAWASEEDFLDFCLARERIRMDVKFTLKPNVLLTIPMGEINPIDKYETKDYSKEIDPPIINRAIHSMFPGRSEFAKDFDQALDGWENEDDADTGSFPDVKPSNPLGSSSAPADEDHHWILDYRASKLETLRLLDKGCAWCGLETKWEKRYSGVYWISEEEYVCKACAAKDKDTLNYVRGEQKAYWEDKQEEFYKANPEQRRSHGFKSNRIKEIEASLKDRNVAIPGTPGSKIATEKVQEKLMDLVAEKTQVRKLFSKTKQEVYVINGRKWYWSDKKQDWLLDVSYRDKKQGEAKKSTEGGRLHEEPRNGTGKPKLGTTQTSQADPYLNDPPFDVDSPTVH